MSLYPIKDLFHKRQQDSSVEKPESLTQEIDRESRRKITLLVFDHQFQYSGNMFVQEYDDMKKLVYGIYFEIGSLISKKTLVADKLSEVMFLATNEQFIDIIEIYIAVKIDGIETIGNYLEPRSENILSFVESINRVFQEGKIGLEIKEVSTMKYIVIPFSSRFLYKETIEHPLSLMQSEIFNGALEEFIDALSRYAKEDYGGAIISCSNAYHSTLKCILNNTVGASVYENDPRITRIVPKIIENTKIFGGALQSDFQRFSSVFEYCQQTIRNQPGISKGQGDVGIKFDDKIHTDYIIRLTGTLISFLIERYNLLYD